MRSEDIPLIAIPNVSEGRRTSLLRRLSDRVEDTGALVLDVHSDPVHDRSVFTVAGTEALLIDAMAALAAAATGSIDLRDHRGVHPRLGALDVCPFVPFGEGTVADAVAAARTTAARIAETGIPVYLYGHAAHRAETRELPDLRAGGLERLARRAVSDLPPDMGPPTIDPAMGAVCVGARDVLIAFNVWFACGADVVRTIARAVRERDGGLEGVRALGLDMGEGKAQVSMNLTAPELTGVDEAFAAVRSIATDQGVDVLRTELVGLPPRRYMPDPDAQAARLLSEPGRSLETVLEEILSSRSA